MEKIRKSEDQWRKELTPQQYHVLREKGTERAFTGEYENKDDAGTYKCAACGTPLFSSEAKYHSGCGWPAFYEALSKDVFDAYEDTSFGMRRVEVTCARCDSHLGHVFPDGPPPTGVRFCINSASLKFEPKK